jgi:hypothetical protein
VETQKIPPKESLEAKELVEVKLLLSSLERQLKEELDSKSHLQQKLKETEEKYESEKEV